MISMKKTFATRGALKRTIKAKECYIEELEDALMSSRLKVAATQIQPHFLYNSLSSIRTIVKVDPDSAYDLIYDFTTHLRSCLSALSADGPVSFKDELESIRAYLKIEQMRFGDKLRVVFDTDCDSFLVAPLSIQPAVENAVRHGIFDRGKAGGTVTIRSRKALNAYIIEISDDGMGFDVGATMAKGGEAVGIENMIFRCETLMRASVTIHSVIGAGTAVKIVIPGVVA